ncbi:MAG: ABC transporter transmembrane domain-containing protein, partial [Desulfatiglandales bacterium]
MLWDKILGKEIAGYLKGHRSLIIGAVLFTSIASLFAIVPAYLLKPFVDLGMVADADKLTWEVPWIKFNGDIALGFEIIRRPILVDVSQRMLLLILSLIAVVSVLIRSLCSYWGALLGAKFSTKVVNKIRSELYAKFLGLHIGFYHGTKTGELVGRANADLSLMQSKISEILTGLIEYPVTSAVFLAYLLYMNYKLTILMLLLVPLFMGILKLFGRKVKKQAERVQEKMSELSQIYHEGITGIKIIQGFTKENEEISKFNGEVNNLYKAIMKWYKWHLGLGPLMDSISFLSVPGILLLGKMAFGHTIGEIVSIAFNPAHERYLLVTGVKECRVVTFGSKWEPVDQLEVNLFLD